MPCMLWSARTHQPLSSGCRAQLGKFFVESESVIVMGRGRTRREESVADQLSSDCVRELEESDHANTVAVPRKTHEATWQLVTRHVRPQSHGCGHAIFIQARKKVNMSHHVIKISNSGNRRRTLSGGLVLGNRT